MAAIAYASVPSYWFVVHPFVDFWRHRRRSPFRAVLPLWIAIMFALGALTWPWHGLRLYSSPFAWVPAFVFFVTGVSVYRRVRKEFGAANFSGQAEMRPAEFEQKLVTTGLHARLRHPIYLAHLCTLLGWTVGSGLAVNYALLAFALVTGAVMIGLEERELARRFGEDYARYRRQVGALIPRLRRREIARTASDEV
jgi:protein-S-isoprenylcysteine O-methyltransferase Ste14